MIANVPFDISLNSCLRCSRSADRDTVTRRVFPKQDELSNRVSPAGTTARHDKRFNQAAPRWFRRNLESDPKTGPVASQWTSRFELVLSRTCLQGGKFKTTEYTKKHGRRHYSSVFFRVFRGQIPRFLQVTADIAWCDGRPKTK